MPNNVPGLVTPEGFYNWYAAQMPKDERFNSLLNRYDYNVSDTQRLYVRWYWNHRLADEYDWTYPTKRGLMRNGLVRINKGGGGNYVWTLNPNNTLDIGVSWTRFSEGNERPTQTAYKPSDVGLPKYLDEKAGDYHTFPRFDFTNIEDIGDSYPVIGTRGTTGLLRIQMNTLKGNHSLKYGWDERRYWTTTASLGYTSGRFVFDNTFTRSRDDDTKASNHVHDWAAFMMGLPSTITIDTNDTAIWSTRYRALYFQDDWRLTSKLRLNLGIRYEREGGITERFNRGIAGGFLADFEPVFAKLVEQAYSANPLPELPASQFKVRGGVSYLGQPHKTFTDGVHHFLPRVGVVYQINPKTVLRAGYGWWYDTLNSNNYRPSQAGYSQATSTVVTTDRGLTLCCGVGDISNLSEVRNPMIDPFPVRADGTRFDQPYRNKLGPYIIQGSAMEIYPRDFDPAWQQRWRIGIQREITHNMVIDVSYNGAYSFIPVFQRINYLPAQYWATGNVRVQAVDDDMNKSLPNPFNIKNLASLQQSDPVLYNFLATRGFFTGTTIRKHQLLRYFPNLSGTMSGIRPGLKFKDVRGQNRYHDIQVVFNRRFTRGFQTTAMYTHATGDESDWYANEFDSKPSWRPQNDIRPHRFVWTAIYELPFGPNRRWLRQGVLSHIVGGWQLSWVYQRQQGPPTDWGNRFFYGDLKNIDKLFRHKEVHEQDIHLWFDPNIAYRGSGPIPEGFQGFEGRSGNQPGSYHVRVFPPRLEQLRADGIRNWDVKIKRVFQITERLRTSIDVDLLNATNHTNFNAPSTDPTSGNFGRVTEQNGLSRLIQFNLRIEF